MNTFFITGTDTDVGKTVATKLLLQTVNKFEKSTLGIKPISAGCENTQGGLRNEDALILQSASGIQTDYQTINPIAFVEPIAPHIAANNHGAQINLHDLQNHLDQVRELKPSNLFIEGAGGWRLPLDNKGHYYSDYALQNQMKVILVVGMKLGCLNHAILTHQSILHDGLECVGWVANQLSSDMPFYKENIETLQNHLSCPMLAEVPYQQAPFEQIEVSKSFSEVFA